MKQPHRPLALPADGARCIWQACKANTEPGKFTNMEVANRVYFDANRGSYEGFQQALKYGAANGMFTVHPSGARIYLPDSGYVEGKI